MRHRLLALLLALACLDVAAAERPTDLVERADALEAEPVKVIALLAAYADSGDVEIESRLASAYLFRAINETGHQSLEPESDIQRAIVFANRAYAHGSGLSANLLYIIHSRGFGGTEDDAKALEFLRAGDSLGDPSSRLNYGIALYTGDMPGVARDLAGACERLPPLAFADKPNPVATYWVGLMFFHGECGQKQNPVAAVEAFRVAAENGVTDGMRDYAKAMEFGWAGETDLAKALAWYARGAEQGDSYSLWRIGMAYVDGEGHRADPVEAVRFFQRAVDAGGKKGLVSLAVMYASGSGVEPDLAKARGLYARAAEAGDAHAYRGLAVMALRGEGGPVDPVAASVAYRQALALGEPEDAGLGAAIDGELDEAGRAEAARRYAAWAAGQH